MYITRKPNVKCQIIPIEVYDGILKVIAEDDKHRYVLSEKGHVIKLRRKVCFTCPKSAQFVIVFAYAKHNRVERCCREHASKYGELPEVPELQQGETELSNQQKHAIKIMQRWNNIKVNL